MKKFKDSRWILWACLCPFLALYIDASGILKAERMIANDQGWEMAFYLSPFVFLKIQVVLFIGVVLPIGNLFTTWNKRLFASIVILINLLALTWFRHDVHILAKLMGMIYGLYPLSD